MTKSRIKSEEEYNQILGDKPENEVENVESVDNSAHDASQYFDETRGATNMENVPNPFNQKISIEQIKENLKVQDSEMTVESIKKQIASAQKDFNDEDEKESEDDSLRGPMRFLGENRREFSFEENAAKLYENLRGGGLSLPANKPGNSEHDMEANSIEVVEPISISQERVGNLEAALRDVAKPDPQFEPMEATKEIIVRPEYMNYQTKEMVVNPEYLQQQGVHQPVQQQAPVMQQAPVQQVQSQVEPIIQQLQEQSITQAPPVQQQPIVSTPPVQPVEQSVIQPSVIEIQPDVLQQSEPLAEPIVPPNPQQTSVLEPTLNQSIQPEVNKQVEPQIQSEQIIQPHEIVEQVLNSPEPTVPVESIPNVTDSNLLDDELDSELEKFIKEIDEENIDMSLKNDFAPENETFIDAIGQQSVDDNENTMLLEPIPEKEEEKENLLSNEILLDDKEPFIEDNNDLVKQIDQQMNMLDEQISSSPDEVSNDTNIDDPFNIDVGNQPLNSELDFLATSDKPRNDIGNTLTLALDQDSAVSFSPNDMQTLKNEELTVDKEKPKGKIADTIITIVLIIMIIGVIFLIVKQVGLI